MYGFYTTMFVVISLAVLYYKQMQTHFDTYRYSIYTVQYNGDLKVSLSNKE